MSDSAFTDSRHRLRRARASRWSALLGVVAALLLSAPTAGAIASAGPAAGAEPLAVQSFAGRPMVPSIPPEEHQSEHAGAFGEQPLVARPAAPISGLHHSRGGSRLVQPTPVAALPLSGVGPTAEQQWRTALVAEASGDESTRTERGRGPPAQQLS